MSLGSVLDKGNKGSWSGKGHVAKGSIVRGFPSLPIAKRNLYNFWENVKPRRVNIKALGP